MNYRISITLLLSFWLNATSQIGIKAMEVIGRFTKYDSIGYLKSWGWTGPNCREYAIVGVQNGISFVDLQEFSNLSNLELKEVSFVEGARSQWRDTKTYRQYCYSVANKGFQGIQIIDMSDLPNQAKLIKLWRGDSLGIFSSSKNIWIDTSRALLFATGYLTLNVHIIDIQDPINPKILSIIPGEAGGIHTTNGGYDDKKWLVVSTGRAKTLKFWDIENPRLPVLLIEERLPPGNGGYSSQCLFFNGNRWGQLSSRYLACAVETIGAGILIYDTNPIKTLQRPILINRWALTPSPDAMVQNIHLDGGLLFSSQNNGGLRVLNWLSNEHISEIGYHNPSLNTSAYKGSISTYSSYPSKKVVQVDDSLGVFVLSTNSYWNDYRLDNYCNVPTIDRNSLNGFQVRMIGNTQLQLSIPLPGKYWAQIYDASGKVFLREKVSGSHPKISWEKEWMPPGTYFINLKGEKDYKAISFQVK